MPSPAPCPAPPGGWHATNTSRIGFGDFQAFQDAAQGAPDFTGLWVSDTSSSAPVNDFQHTQVTIVGFTGNIAVHEQQLAALWGGPVCVVQQPHTYAELQGMTTLLVNAKDLGVQFISAGPYEVDNVVRFEVVAATPETQRDIDRRFGPGLVKVVSLMKPVP